MNFTRLPFDWVNQNDLTVLSVHGRLFVCILKTASEVPAKTDDRALRWRLKKGGCQRKINGFATLDQVFQRGGGKAKNLIDDHYQLICIYKF